MIHPTYIYKQAKVKYQCGGGLANSGFNRMFHHPPPAGQASQQGGRIHRGRHIHGMRYTRLQRTQWRMDHAAQGLAPAESQNQLPVCPAQPHPHGLARPDAERQAEIHLQPKR